MYKSIYFLASLFLISVAAVSQTTVTINASSPLDESYYSGPIFRASASSNVDYSQYAYLYTAAELGPIAAGTFISSIAWNKISTNATTLSGGGKFRIYLKNSTVLSYNNNPFGISFGSLINVAALVYSNDNTVIPATAGFLQFPFISPFVYTGGNLEVIVDWDISSVAGNPTTGPIYWQITSTDKKIFGYAGATAALSTSNSLKPEGNGTVGNITNTRPVVRFTLSGTLPACIAPPSGGSVIAVDSICMGVNTILRVAGASGGSNSAQGLSYQWQSSANSVEWNNIGTISDDSITVSQYTANFYRRILTCGSGSDTSAVKFIDVKPYYFAGCVCSPTPKPCFSFSTYISRVQLGTLDKSSDCGGDSYTDYSDSVSAPDFYLSTSKFLNVTLTTTNTNTKYIQAWIDFNHDGIFNDAVTDWSTTGSSITGTLTVPATAFTGFTRMRIQYRSTSNISPQGCGPYTQNYETEDYLINIVDAAACTTAPVNDITIASVPAVCTSDSVLLSTSGANDPVTSFSYQWQSSADSIVWQDIQGFKARTCAAYQNSTRFYRTRIGCASQYIYTTPVKVIMKPLINCYCKLYRSSCDFYDKIQRVVFGTLDHSSDCSANGYIDYSDSIAAPLIQSGTAVPISVTLPDGITAFVNVWIDYNMNGEFDTTEHTYVGTGSNTTLTKAINIPLSAFGGLTKMRVREKKTINLNSSDACSWIYYGGETEDYLVNIVGLGHCIPAGSSICSNGDVINRVIFGTIDTATSCSPNGFGDFTKSLQSNTVTANTYVPLSVQVGCGASNPENVGVWIDFNQNGVYERNEFTLVGRDCSTTITNNISIPTNALAGQTNMRIRATADNRINPSDACMNYVHGETEEHKIMVQPYSVCPTNTWTGLAGDNDWNNAANWSCQAVPGVHSNVVINSGTVVISNDVTVYSLNANPAATVTVVPPYNLVVTH